jgi:integrase
MQAFLSEHEDLIADAAACGYSATRVEKLRMSRRVVVAAYDRALTLPELYDHWKANALDALRAKLADVDLAPLIDQWEERARRTLKAETARKYVGQVAWLFPRDEHDVRKPVMRSTITSAWLSRKLAQVPASNTNGRRHGQAWIHLFKFLKERGVFERSPMLEVELPPSNKVNRERIDRFRDVLRYIDAMPDGLHRALAAVREGAGLEISAALAMRRSDVVDEENRIVWAHGDKNDYRDRQVIIERWAWKRFWSYVKAGGFHPDALLFPVTDVQHREVHTEVCADLRARGFDIPKRYTPHCCRNTFAVRNIKRGVDLWVVSNNLGHADTTTVQKLYGKFRPKLTDLVRVQRERAQGGD